MRHEHTEPVRGQCRNDTIKGSSLTNGVPQLTGQRCRDPELAEIVGDIIETEKTWVYVFQIKGTIHPK